MSGACDVVSLVQCLEYKNLSSEEKLKEALLQLTNGLSESHYECLIRSLLLPPPSITRPAMELVLASMECGKTLTRWLEDHFPSNHEKFPVSLHALILDRLSISLLFSYAFDREVVIQLNSFRSLVEYGPLAIEALTQISRSCSQRDPENLDEDILPSFVKVKRTQRQRKGARSGPKPRFDAKMNRAFEVYGIDASDFSVDFNDVNHEIRSVLDVQRDILKTYIELLQDPKVEGSIRQTYLLREISNHQVESLSPESPIEIQEAKSSTTTMPPAFPMVQPMKAALYFDSAEGFGEWRILISTRADRDLREARRKDAKFFKIVIKKIKELSKGHFSDDNQKRLNGHQTDIPIYEAKMTRDSRLIYQIDCIPEYNADVERQVVKIFGVYTHAQIDQRLWDSVGHQLGRKGKEYKQRCIFRNRPEPNRGGAFTPACFPPMEETEEKEQTFPALPHESLEEIHALLVLEKFMPFSQALLNSIIADLDVAHVFDVSPQEKEIVEYPQSCYVLGRSGTGKTTTMMFKMLGIERAYAMRKDSMQKPRQIFVTQSRVLAGKVEEYFSKLLDSLATAEKSKEELAQLIKMRKQQKDDEGLIDIDDDQNWRNDLPQKFSELRDENFPLFLTFDRLASLLEADISMASASGFVPMGSSDDANVVGIGGMKLIDYKTFLDSYWPHLSQSLKKGLDPALVYSELMGVIQGSEESLNHESHFLDKNAYENLSHRAQYAFASRRDIIYSIFLLYLKQKRIRNEYDAADRTHSILAAFKIRGVPGQKIDYLYVDEAQDNLLIDALLLRSLVRNPDGLFWAGDTAQTISVGSSFRFNDLKAFLYRLERRRESSLLGLPQVTTQEPPQTFQLTVNYRSHGGIVQCAHSVIELITEFWPYAIDILSKEKGVVDGSKPVFFSGWDSDTVRYEQFLFGESGSPIEFGAQQCILVRDEAAREDLRQQVGDIGLIMTLYESKGLEFDDVLLYKFFEDSTVELSQWRVVLNLLLDGIGQAAPQFDEIRHAGVCSELKSLYVAITRARKNLWIVDCSAKSEPMRVFWTSRNEVQNCTPGTDVPRLAVSSSPQEWEKSGRTLFQNKRYLQAMHCFERAGLNREVEVSHTYYLREQARSLPASSFKQAVSSRRAAFIVAAEAFSKCSVVARSLKEKKVYLRNAGECFVHAEEDFKAADAYNQAEEYNTAVKLYRKCARFDEAVAIVTQNGQGVEAEVAENIIDIARLFYFKGGELEKASQLFTSVEEQLEYLEDFDLDVSRAALLEKLGKFYEAADIHLFEGRTLEAIRLLLIDQDNLDSVRRANDCILHGLWEKVSFSMKGLDQIDGVPQLLALASKVRQSSMLDSVVADELSMFHFIDTGDSKNLRVLGRKFASDNHLTSAVLCFDHFFQSWPNIRNMSSADISELLEDFLQYCIMLQQLASIPNPSINPRIQRLFGIVPSSDNVFFLPFGTFLHARVIESRAILAGSNDQGIYISEWELSHRFRESLVERLNSRILVEANACVQDAAAFYPCPLHTITSHCYRRECPRQHVSAAELTHEWYNLHIKVHLQQILVIQVLAAPPLRKGDRLKHVRFWISRLYEILYPITYLLGGITNFDVARIPEARKAFSALRQWCFDVLYYQSHNHYSDPALLTTFYQIIKLSFYLDKTNATRFLNQSRLMNSIFADPKFHRKAGDQAIYILPELVSTLSSVSYDTICRGVLFVKHLLDNMLTLDAIALCELIDYLCGSIILIRNKLALHNVTLPLSWLKNLLHRVNLDPKANEKDFNPTLDILVTVLRQLIDSMYMGKNEIGHLVVLAEKSDLYNLGAYRNIYIARLCRSICLLGYNVNNKLLRSEIVKTMRSLKTGFRPNNLYKDFAYARDWSTIARLVQTSVNESSLDEMIQLYHESKVSTSRSPPKGIRRIVYKTIADISRLLDNPRPAIVSNLRADAPEFVPRPRIAETPADDDIEAEQDIEEPEVDDTEIINTAHSAESIAVAALPEEHVEPSQEQIQAAIRIQTLYRKVMRLRRKIPKNILDASRQSCFEACLQESFRIEWPNGNFYRMLFLGPLPHVLVCLNAARTWALEAKKRNKKRFTSATHQDLEDVNKRLTEQKKIIDGIQKIQRTLNPLSDIHRRRDVEELKRRVLEVDSFLREKVPTVARDVAEDMAIGLKGIIAIKQAPKSKAKPVFRLDHDENDTDDRSLASNGMEGKAFDDKIVEVVLHGRISKEKISGPPMLATVQKESVPTVVQSLPWTPVLPSKSPQNSPTTARKSAHGDRAQASDMGRSTMQSLSWVPI
ncbi:hypothetical protein CPB84DRAFT_1782432 [Gymnopilus junonius]|uniref:UvrD-like helicase ATP-binding domain-containing protein n=1 Tax=Gymnopilus junonius TaxID=109634 RepID=A0A9P5TM52_GYMJU|nr:hypothetical protein CPB84DRAFT_1782432 [Gymnopilus junonius]